LKEYIRKIDEIIEKFELTTIRDYIHKNIKNSIYLSLIEEDTYEEQGTSRVGGYPDLPENFKWPNTKDGIPMTFIAQLNLNEISTCDENNLLPRRGILYFFIGRLEHAYDIEHKVIFIEEEENLKLEKTKDITVLEKENKEIFKAFKISGTSYPQLPNYAYVNCDEVEDTETYFELEEHLLFMFKRYIGKIYGYPAEQHNDSELEAALKIIANCNYNHSRKEIKNLADSLDGNIEKANEEVRDMVMLLEIDSDASVGFQWWNSGTIHFFIRKEDLKNRNFNRTYLSLYSS
jgi:uncharacterized protein YwqG